MKIALCQINTTVGDFAGNVQKVLASLKKAKADGCELALFPELTLTGYPPRDLLDRLSFFQQAQKALETVAQGAQGIAAIVGTIQKNDGSGFPLFNSAVAVKDGKVLHVTHKTLLPNYDVFDEARYFSPSPAPSSVWEYQGLRIGLTICEDIWNVQGFSTYQLYQRDPVTELVSQKPDLILNLSASPFHAAKLGLRQKLLKSTAGKAKCAVIYCNLTGGNDELIFDGCSMVVDPAGQVLQLGQAFEEDYLVHDTQTSAKPLATKDASDVETVYQALVLGTGDYVRKCGFQKVLLGLSGGIDSALVAALATEALGPDNVLGVTMPSPFSSQGSIDDSRQLAKALGIQFQEIPITPVFDTALKQLTPYFEGKPADTTEENMQARLRGLILMALSNKLNRLLVTRVRSRWVTALYMGTCVEDSQLSPTYPKRWFTNWPISLIGTKRSFRPRRSPKLLPQSCDPTKKIKILCRPMTP